MNITDVLTQFAATGGVGPLRPLAALGDITAKLGPPQDVGRVASKRHWPHWYRYGDVTLEVCRCQVVNRVRIDTYRDTVTVPTEAGRLTTLRARAAYGPLEAALAAKGIIWTTVLESDVGCTTEIELPDEVTIHFTFVGNSPVAGPEGLPVHGAQAQEFTHACGPAKPDDQNPDC
ncbi:hypothetical protein [Streptomyces sp. CA-251247]|uniref:hypothetical protein n=1 Tax=Streptomyces sp. CA-251247 TaxID=3240062 RepID=UPI003D93A66F